ncbi:MAG: hypothetical protein A2283_13230 [Lentisphaerae bacterium RIFOXYA12_FULL_48_11]|nr:MAG: hypothetical protein A2283_13230 [Lentisphaerae bacterium RIFOXYA12_FULL_48_11]
MTTKQTRRNFLKTATVCVGTIAGSKIIGAPYILADKETRAKLRTVVIGCGGQGTGNHTPVAAREQLVALVDPDDKRLAKAMEKAKQTNPKVKMSIKTFNDYRKLFDKMAKEIDVVFIASPNHHHALPALMAMKLGKHVYVEKPLTHTIAEARLMADYARQYKVATQMGNQGHSGEGYRRLCEYIWSGAIGPVKEVFCWSNRANGGNGPRPPVLPVPEGMHWDEWIGPSPFRDYHKDLHPHEWHGWHDFGNGSLGNMGCHIMDGTFWALKLGYPTTVEAEQMIGGSDERYPIGTRIRWDFPAREGMEPVKLYWYDGLAKDQPYNKQTVGAIDCVVREATNRPPFVVELEKKYNRDFGSNGSILVGDKGIMTIGQHGDGCRMVPEEAHRAFPMPAATLPRIKGTHQSDFFRACRGGAPACANFDYSEPLAEIVLLGDLAMRAGAGRLIKWDGPAMRCTNLPELNRFIKPAYREGWRI